MDDVLHELLNGNKGANGQTICDRNSNCVTLGNVIAADNTSSSSPVYFTSIQDDLQRQITITYDTENHQDLISLQANPSPTPATGSKTLEWTVQWKRSR